MQFAETAQFDTKHSPAIEDRPTITNVAQDVPSIEQIFETMTFQAGFNTNTVIAGTTLLGLGAGVIGVFALLRKRSLVTDALSHATLPGIALAFLVATWLGIERRTLPILLLGATATAVIGVICIQAMLRLSRLREDAAIGIVLSVFFGAGIVGLSYIQTNAPAGSAGLTGFIYGQAATMQPPDVILMAVIAFIGIIATLLFFKEFSLICFNDSFAEVDGWPVTIIDLLMMSLIIMVMVAGLQAVGLILVVAMLIIPAVTARLWTERLSLLVLVAGVIGACSGYLGSVLSALLPRKPAGAVIVLTCGILFFISLIAAPNRGVVASIARRVRLRLRFAGDHFLEYAHELASPVVARHEVIRIGTLRGWSPLFRWVVVVSLRRKGYAKQGQKGSLVLLPKGRHRGAQVARNHLLWEQYLITYADIASNHVDWSVDQVEHILDKTVVRELEHQLVAKGINLPTRQPAST